MASGLRPFTTNSTIMITKLSDIRKLVNEAAEDGRRYDKFWSELLPKDLATLRTTFLLVSKVDGDVDPAKILKCGRDEKHPMPGVFCENFFIFTRGHVETCDSAEKMLAKIIEWGKLSKRKQERAMW